MIRSRVYVKGLLAGFIFLVAITIGAGDSFASDPDRISIDSLTQGTTYYAKGKDFAVPYADGRPEYLKLVQIGGAGGGCCYCGTADISYVRETKWNSSGLELIIVFRIPDSRKVGQCYLGCSSGECYSTKFYRYTFNQVTGLDSSTRDSDGDYVVDAKDWSPNNVSRSLDVEPEKGNGPPGLCDNVGNPCSGATGNKFEEEPDYFSGDSRIFFTRYYNSRHHQRDYGLGIGWTSNIDQRLVIEGTTMLVQRGNGRSEQFLLIDGLWTGDPDSGLMITTEPSGMTIILPDGASEKYDLQGKLIATLDRSGNPTTFSYGTDGNLASITGPFGHMLLFAYDEDGHRTSMTDAGGGVYLYSYDLKDNLVQVTYPDNSVRAYYYENLDFPNHLTGIGDENGDRYATFAYDIEGRSVTTEHAQTTNAAPQERFTLSYDSGTQTSVTDAAGNIEIRNYEKNLEVKNLVSKIKQTDGKGYILQYDDNNNLISQTDSENRTKSFTYNSSNQLVSTTEALGTPQERTIGFEYVSGGVDLLTRVTTPSVAAEKTRQIVTVYDDHLNPTSITILGHQPDGTAISDTITFQYNSASQVTEIDGPRSDVEDITTITYNSCTSGGACGLPNSISNALGHITTYDAYNAHGWVTQTTQPSGVITNYAYDQRGHITAIIRKSFDQDVSNITLYTYDETGQITSIISPNGAALTYTYDAAHDLRTISDNLGNRISYTYDLNGNQIKKEIHDPDGNLMLTVQMAHDLRNRINQINEAGFVTHLIHDAMGNLLSETDPNGKSTTYIYDLLNRIISTTQPGDVTTDYGYDVLGNLTSVTDAENHETVYEYDDFGRLLSSNSPDTGTTAYTYDTAGNLFSKTDANGITVTYTYDALNRLTGIHYPDSAQDVTYSYDAGTNAKGRLTGMTDQSGSYSYSYDIYGNPVSEEKIIEGIAYTTEYTHDSNGSLIEIIYPNGRKVNYTHDDTGRVTGITTTNNGITKTVAENMNYLPFGPLKSLTHGNGMTTTKSFDQRYRLTHISAGNIQNVDYTVGAAGNITAITDNLDPDRNQNFEYDDLYRLTAAEGIYGTIGYTYDKVGNRLTRTIDSSTNNYSYLSGSNKLRDIAGTNPQSFAYDANGNITAMGSKTLTHNQNNRLIRIAENSTVIGEYTYNAYGQRIKKVTPEETIIFHYDRLGNIIGKSTADGNFLEQYLYLGNTRLSVLSGEAPGEITVEVTTGNARALSGINVYAFTADGSYTGKSGLTDENGIARIDVSEFEDGSYKFRTDYLSCQFWSENIQLPGEYSTGIQIAEETAAIQVTQAGVALGGVKVYLFKANGTYLGQYQTTDSNGYVSFDLPAGQEFKFRADILGSQFMSETVEIASSGSNYYTIDGGGGTLTVTVDKGEGRPITGIKIYLFNTGGTYLGYSDQSDDLGQGSFEVPAGIYRLRVDYLGYQFWSHDISVGGDESILVSIPHQDVTVTVAGDYDGDVIPLEDLNVYLFTPSGSYLGRYQVTDNQGRVTFNLPQRDYKVRADYLSKQHWSPHFNWTNETVTINENIAQITVTNAGRPLEGIKVYVFSAGGSYLGLFETTDINGQAAFRLPAGDYNFRADYMSSQYFSGVSTLIAHVNNPVNISTGGGSFSLKVLRGLNIPLVGVKCYLFSDSGSYLGQFMVTSDQGEVGFDLADGSYKIRVDYLGYQFWTDVFSIPSDASLDLSIAHQDVTVTVTGDYDGDVIPLENLNVYLFTPSGSYLSRQRVTDDQGQVTFNLPQMDYKVRADYLALKYWSPVFSWTDETVSIIESVAEIRVTQGTTSLEGVNVYAFSTSGAYLGLSGLTDQDGIVSFRLPEGTYKFRGDYQGSQYWATEALDAHQVNSVNLNTGGGSFTLYVEKETGSPLVDIPVYVFSPSGSYLGVNARTDDQGQVTFDLADGDYKFRADYFGYQFFSPNYSAPGSLSDVLTIMHQDVTVGVNQIFGSDSDPLEGIKVYLFSGSGSYQGVYKVTDEQGRVTFNVPLKDYKVRADYLSHQHWSDVFSWQDVEVDINHGIANLQVTRNGQDVYDAPVYLFSESGSYLGQYDKTDSNGQVQFVLPADSYKFRVDYDGIQHWSDVISILPHEENDTDLRLELLAANLTNNPNPDRFDGEPPAYEPEKIMVASLGTIRGILFHSVVGQTTEGQEIYYIVNDHLGTPQKLLNENGDVVWSADYEPFGKADVYINTYANNFRFPGQYFDEETGLHYNYHRYYDPKLGRYLTPDPIGLAGGINLYAYVKNNSINLIDPLGLEFSDILPGIRTAIFQGAKGGAFAVGEAAKATTDIAMNGHPLAKAAIGVAVVSEIIPLSGAAVISSIPAATSVILLSAPHSPVILDATLGFFTPGPPPISPAGYAGMSARQFVVDPLLDATKHWLIDKPLKNNCE